MEIPVLIEPLPGAGFVARTGSPFEWSAEGVTAEEAVQKLQAVAVAREVAGLRTSTIALNGSEHPLAKFAGSMKDSPLWDDWRKAIEEYREAIENDPNR